MFSKLKSTYHEFPKNFWLIVVAAFVDGIGMYILFPFFGLYITGHFDVGVTEVGVVFMLFSMGGIIGGILGGTIADKLGRKGIILFGMITSGLSSVFLGYFIDISFFYFAAIIVGVFGNIGGPGRQAMVSDILPGKQYVEGFGILRVASNLAAIIGPAIGGFLAVKDFMLIFYADAILGIGMAIILWIFLPETKPEKKGGEKLHSLVETLKGYRLVIKDRIFMAFFGVFTLTTMVFIQLNTTLSVFLFGAYNFPADKFGLLLTMNATIIVVFQFWVTRKIKKFPPMIMMAIGSLLYTIGFTMFGFVSQEILFLVAMIIITMGNMITAPFSQSLVSFFALEDKRGRYMAIFGFSWILPMLIGVLGAGIILDGPHPNWLWYLSGILLILAVMGYLWLHQVLKQKTVEEKGNFPNEDNGGNPIR
ncbi:MDR family MFS transporter [Promethearchaeum syntrophicum]|uniref:MDR family MFS transporter n=1 Tax=Promethearchaeum syntrophicum TaxID=2594042 RepID=A0A5B9D7E4_9ARCH|nr:MFS transporter [Candidatus Prometheoarchaeum syntrophicum]QEE15044.1 multidrug resistance protein MdtH [Candidatus Prometheoarchaeum syntrophicum]